jgi:hypothetical protein
VKSKILSVMGDRRFVAMICDADEIPSTSLAKALHNVTLYDRIHGGARIHMITLLYNFKFVSDASLPWVKPFVVTDKLLRDTTYSNKIEAIRRDESNSVEIFRFAGWHCSFFMSVQQIQYKIQSFSHQEYNTPEITSEAAISDAIDNGKDILRRKMFVIRKYDGLFGFPLPCKECSWLTGYNNFNIPSAEVIDTLYRSGYPREFNPEDRFIPRSPGAVVTSSLVRIRINNQLCMFQWYLLPERSGACIKGKRFVKWESGFVASIYS